MLICFLEARRHFQRLMPAFSALRCAIYIYFALIAAGFRLSPLSALTRSDAFSGAADAKRHARYRAGTTTPGAAPNSRFHYFGRQFRPISRRRFRARH